MAFVHALALFLFALPSSFISLWMFGKHGLLKEKPSRSQGPAGHVWCDLTCVYLSLSLPNTVRVSCASHRVLYATHPREAEYKKYIPKLRTFGGPQLFKRPLPIPMRAST